MKAWELLSDPNKWLQGELAHDAKDNEVSPESQYAVCWCILGAIDRCYATHSEKQAAKRKLEPGEATSDQWKECQIAKWNDDISRTHAQVVQRLKDADV